MNIKLSRNGEEVEFKIQHDEKGLFLINDTIIPEDEIEVTISKTETEKFPLEIYVGGTKSGSPIKLLSTQVQGIYK